MKNVIQGLKEVGADESTVNFFLRLFMVFLFIMGIGAAVGAGWFYYTGKTPPPWLIAIASGLFTTAITLISSAHGVKTTESTASQVSSQVNSNTQEALTTLTNTLIANNTPPSFQKPDISNPDATGAVSVKGFGGAVSYRYPATIQPGQVVQPDGSGITKSNTFPYAPNG